MFMFRAINPYINTVGSTYWKSNDNFVKDINLEIIDCSLWTSPFSYINTIHHSFNFGNILDIYQYPKNQDYNMLKQIIINYFWDTRISTDNIHLWHWGLVLLERLATKFFWPSHIIGIWPQFPYFISDHIKIGWRYTNIELFWEDRSFDYDLYKLKLQINKGRYDICYIDNPNNPTWYYFDTKLIEEVIVLCKKKWIICIIDEAYGSFIDKASSCLHLVTEYDNLIVLRSFSKWFWLSWARAWYLICGDILSELYRKIDNWFEPSAISLQMCMEAANHDEFMRISRENVKEIKQDFLPALKKLWYTILPNHENVSIFLMYKEWIDLHKYLQYHNILTSPWVGYSCTSKIINENYVRVLVPQNKIIMNDFLKRIQ